MNIIKLQDMLRGVPDDALIGYVKNPQGEVPSYLALSELQRRKDTRAKYQAEQAPESSVAEELTQTPSQGGLATLAKNPQPGAPMSQGVADLPVADDMYQEDSFAAGGIVAFEDGGDVKRYAAGDYVIPSKTPSEYYQAIKGNKDIGKSFMFNKFESPYDEAIKYYAGLKNVASDPESARQLDNAISELQMQKYHFVRSKEDPTERMMQTGLRPTLSGKPLPKAITLEDLDKKITGNTNPPPPSADPVKQVKEGATGQKQDEPTIKTTESVEVTGDPFYFEERPEVVAETERQRFKDMYGEDPFAKRGKERLEKMEARAKRMEDMAPGMAMLEAGLSIAGGSSPFALQNIGQGALAGVKSYGEAQNRLADLEEKRFNVDSKLADAQRTVELAAMQHGFKSEEYNKAANDLKRLELLKGKLDIKKYETLAGTNETKMVMKQKQDFLRDRDKYLKDNWRIKNAIDVYNDQNAFNKLNETQKQAVLQDVNTYNLYVQNLKLSYPLANMDLPTRDPIALLNKTIR